jgi:hypothetical protein
MMRRLIVAPLPLPSQRPSTGALSAWQRVGVGDAPGQRGRPSPGVTAPKVAVRF